MQTNTNNIIFVFVIGLLPVIGQFCGCGHSKAEQSYSQLGLVNVTGTIRLDNQPLPDAQIQFIHENGSFSYGVTDADGKYRLYFDTRHEGIRPGSKTVRVWTTMKGPGFDQLQQGNDAAKEIIPIQYNHESTLTVTVEPQKPQTFDFELKSGGKTKNAPSCEGDAGVNP